MTEGVHRTGQTRRGGAFSVRDSLIHHYSPRGRGWNDVGTSAGEPERFRG